ncbi:unnamed protein product [Microthlaspi erraticum]|uniref:Reverse transcriptase domain-containing protein n=1 Tax=Microthlaspi erraticum TaxID=1685480 RepID=A0A6D2KLN0_9BRAS|nr:unnamed protein product [Microthlaspi erraticum]
MDFIKTSSLRALIELTFQRNWNGLIWMSRKGVIAKRVETVQTALSREQRPNRVVRLAEERMFRARPKLQSHAREAERPRSFVLSCKIGSTHFHRALCDLGSSVNLMPYSVAKLLGITDFKPTKISLVFADRSVRRPVGVIMDVPIMVGDCYIPADFVVLELEHQPKDPLILGRPFLATAGAIIDVKNGKIDLHLGDIVMNFEVNKSMEKPTVDGQAFWIGELAETREEVLDELLLIDPLELALTKLRMRISPELCTHRIILEDESSSSIEHQRRLNPNLKEVVKKEIMKLLKGWSDYPISDSAWVSPVHVVPKKGGITVIKNEHDELIPTRTITGHRMCVDYRKLNSSTRKDHYPLPFIDQMLERLANHQYYCFLDGYSGSR